MTERLFGCLILLMAVLTLLGGCAGASEPAIHCPKLVEYPRLEQQVLADELTDRDGPEAAIFIGDYLKLRAHCRTGEP